MAHLKQIRQKHNQNTSFTGILMKETYSSEASVLQETYNLKCQGSEYKFIHASEDFMPSTSSTKLWVYAVVCKALELKFYKN